MKNFWGIFAIVICMHMTAGAADTTSTNKIDAFITKRLKGFSAETFRLRKKSGKFEKLPEGYLLPGLFVAYRAVEESSPEPVVEQTIHIPTIKEEHTPEDCFVYGCKTVVSEPQPKVAFYEVEYTIYKRDTLNEISAAIFFFVLEHLLNNSKTHTGPYRLLVNNPEEVQSDLNFLEKKAGWQEHLHLTESSMEDVD